MSANTGIEWTDHSWNPLVAYDLDTGKRGWFCSHVSPGCVNCYAETINRRLGTGHDYKAQSARRVRVEVHEPTLSLPLRWRKPKRVFVCSMTDLFHAEHTDAQIAEVVAIMAFAGQHQFQVLTKRPERARQLFTSDAFFEAVVESVALRNEVPLMPREWPLRNVWLGTSVESQRYADERIPELLATPAAVRFLSCEPLLGPLTFPLPCKGSAFWSGLHWFIVGGESGGGARPCDVQWIRSIVEQCRGAGVACFVKQLGAHPCFRLEDEERRGNTVPSFHHSHGDLFCKKLSDRKGGDPAEWPAELRVREFPEIPA